MPFAPPAPDDIESAQFVPPQPHEIEHPSTELEEFQRGRTTPERKTGFFENLAAGLVKPAGEIFSGAADVVASNKDVEGGDEYLKGLLQDEITRQRMDQPTRAGKVGGFIGNIVGPILTAAGTSTVAGPSGVVGQFGLSGYHNAFLSAGLNALKEGHTFDDAVQIGKKSALAGGAAQAAIGLIPGPKVAPGASQTLLQATGQGIKYAGAAAAGQLAENATQRGLGLNTPLSEGVAESALTMGLLPPGIHLLKSGLGRLVRTGRRQPTIGAQDASSQQIAEPPSELEVRPQVGEEAPLRQQDQGPAGAQEEPQPGPQGLTPTGAGSAVAGAGKGVVSGLYDSMWDRLQKTGYPEPFKTEIGDRILAEFQAGRIKSAEDIRAFANKPAPAATPTPEASPVVPPPESGVKTSGTPLNESLPDKMMAEGEVATTSSGRQTSPFPRIDATTERKTASAGKRVDAWLRQNALDEAVSRGDGFNQLQFEHADPKKLTQAEKDSMNEYLFGQQPPVPRPLLKPLRPAESVTPPVAEEPPPAEAPVPKPVNPKPGAPGEAKPPEPVPVSDKAFPSLLEFAKRKLPKSAADKVTSESQVESFRAQWEKERAAVPTAPVPEAPTDVEHLLQAPVADVEAQQANVKLFNQRRRELQSDRDKVDAEIKASEKLIMNQRGARYLRGRIKTSARKADVANYRGLQQQRTKISQEIEVLDNMGSADRTSVDQNDRAKIVTDSKQPLLLRLETQIGLLQDQKRPVPSELVAARDQELNRVVLEKYPDATPQEIAKMSNSVRQASYFGRHELWNQPNAPDLYALRRQELSDSLKQVGYISDPMQEKLKRYLPDRRVYGEKAPVEDLTPKEIKNIQRQVETEGKAFQAKQEADRIQAEQERAAEEAKGREMMAEAQAVADSAGKPGAAGGRTAKEVRTDLVGRLKSAIDAILAKDSVTLTKREDGSYLAQSASEFGDAAFGEIKPSGNKFKVTTSQPGKEHTKVSAVVDSMEEAEWLIKAMATGASGKAVIGVPGDGVFRLMNHGPTLLKVWRDAQRIDTGAGSKPRVTSGGPAAEPPTNIKTHADWSEAKEYHGLEPLDKISTWSPALEAIARKVNPEAPQDVTTHDVDNWIKAKSGKSPEAAPADVDERIAAQKKAAEQAANDTYKDIGTTGNPARMLRYYKEELKLMKLYLEKGFLVAKDGVEKFAEMVGRKVNAVMAKAWIDATTGTEESDPAKLPALSKEDAATVVPERTTTQVLGSKMEIGSRPGSSSEADAAAIAHQHKMIDDAGDGLSDLARPGPRGTVTFEPDGFLHEVAGRNLIQALHEQLPENWGESDQEQPPGLTPLFNTIAQEFYNGNLNAVFGEPIARKLFSMTQSVVSHWGLMLQSRQRFGESLQKIFRDPMVHLQYEWGKMFGGSTYEGVFDRVMRDLTERLGPAAEEILKNNPAIGEFVDRIIQANMQDSGSRVYRRIQGLFKPKSAKKLEQLMGDARFQEAVQEILAQLKGNHGLEPKPRPGKKPLTPREQMEYLAHPDIADKVDNSIRRAVREGERKAARESFQKENNLTDDEMMAYDDRTVDPAAEGPDPTPEQVEQGLKSPEFAHWKKVRDTLADYSPVTLDLAQKVLRGDFKGTKFKPTPEKLADMRIDLAKLAKQPDAEVARVLDAWRGTLGDSLDMAGATVETRMRIEQMMREELAGQLDRIRQQVRDPLFADKVKRGKPLTPDEKMLQLVNAKLFADPRLDIPAMVAQVAGKPAVGRLLPTMGDLVKKVLETPFFNQSELKARFSSETVDRLGIDPAQSDRAWAVFEKAFADKFAEAKSKAAEKALASLTPKDRQVITSKSITDRILANINAGNLDSADVLQKVVLMKGGRIPSPAEIQRLKDLGERLLKLRSLDPKELAEEQAFGSTPEQIEAARAEKENSTIPLQATIERDMATLWASMTRPITLRSFTSEQGLKNVRDAAREYVVLNLLTKIGHLTRFPIHLATQVATHFGSRPIAQAFESISPDSNAGLRTVGAVGRQVAAHPIESWQKIAHAYAQEWAGFKRGLRPAWVAGRAEALGRGEGRNVDGLMESMQTFGRLENKAEAYRAAGNYPMYVITRLLGIPEYAGRWISVIDQYQGNPAVYADILHQADLEMMKAGWTPAQRTALQAELVNTMKYEISQAMLETAAVLDSSGEAVTPRQIEENAWGLVKFRLSEVIRNAGLPADAIAQRNEALRRQLAWQDQVRRGVGGLVAKAVGVFGKAWPPLGAFSNAIGQGINWTLAKLPPGLHMLADVNLIGKEGKAPSNFFGTSADKKQRLIESIGVTMGGALLGGLLMNRMARYNPFITTAKERQEMEREGRKPGTIDFILPDGKVSTWSLIVGPMTLFAPWIAGFGAASNLMQRREKAQEHMNQEALKQGLVPGKIRDISTMDWLSVAGQAAVTSILGSKTAGGWTTQFVDPNQGFAGKRALASQIQPFVPGLPGWNEISRMMGVSMSSSRASVFDYLVPLPSSGARAVNVLGDPVGTRDSLQRVVQVLTGGSYPFPHSPEPQEDPAYGALASSGFHPPAVSPNKGFDINGTFRPMNDSELERYTVARGQLFKAKLAQLGSGASKDDVAAAFQEANGQALAGVNASAPATGGSGRAARAAGPAPSGRRTASRTGRSLLKRGASSRLGGATGRLGRSRGLGRGRGLGRSGGLVRSSGGLGRRRVVY